MTEDSKRNLKTVPFRLSFSSNLLEPKKDQKTGRVSYPITMLFPPGTDFKPFKAALAAAMEEKFGDDRSKWPELTRKPSDVIKDAKAFSDNRVKKKKKPLDGYDAGWFFIRASAAEKYPPGVAGPIKEMQANGKLEFPKITDVRDCYPGRWARATIEAYYYTNTEGDGVTFGLRNVQLLKHDKNLGGAVSAPENDFDDADAEMLGDDFDKGAKATAKADDDDWG